MKFIASKQRKKFHLELCPFAQKIDVEENSIFFEQSDHAKKLGFQECSCVKAFQQSMIDQQQLGRKFIVLQHFSEYTNPIAAIHNRYN